MKTVQWQMQENFNFPASTGMPTGVETVKVTPRFTIDRTEASVRLTGIYHLAVNVEFDGEVNELSERIDDEDIIFIDDVDKKETEEDFDINKIIGAFGKAPKNFDADKVKWEYLKEKHGL